MSVSIMAMVGCLAAGAPGPEFLEAHDMVWETPPVKWNTGIPLANGDIGALIWGDGAPLKITLDKYDAWETREKFPDDVTYARLRQLIAEDKKKEAEQIMRTERIYGDGPYPTRLPMPRLELDFGQPLVWESARLRLATATAEIVGRVGGEPLRITAVTHANQNLLLIRLEGGGARNAAVKVSLDHLNDGAKATLKKWGYADPETTTNGHGGTLFQKTPSGYSYAVAWERVQKDSPGVQEIAVAIVSSEDRRNPLRDAKALARRAASGLDLAGHQRWWTEYWKRSYLTIPDARLEALYYIEMYKLGCLSRPGKLPITLQGLWTLDGGMPPWSGDYHLDMNVQQSYWPIYTANRLELGKPLYDTFSKCLPRWQQDCRKFFGFDGIWAGCAIGPRGERVFGYSGVELWPGNAAWLAHHYWLHYLYSQDKEFLREQALPMLRGSFLTYANLLERGDDGKLHVPLSYSPEWGEGGFSAYCKDPTVDLALIRFLGNALLESNEVFGAEDPLTPRVREALENLAPYPRRGNRLLISADTPLSHSHRHHSHLMAIHPLSVLTLKDGDEDRAIIRDSLLEVRTHGTGQWTGWAFPWMSLIASRAGYGNMAWQMLETYANAFITPNTFHINGDPRIHGVSLFDYDPMTLEAGFGAAAALMEMLLQSYNGTIRLFPTLPDRWHDAYFEDLRAEGAFLVTARLAAGQVVFARITSEAGRLCAVKNPFPNGVAALESVDVRTGEALAPSKEVSGGRIEFPTQPGGTYLLYPKGTRPPAEAMQPPRFDRTAPERNIFGVKRLPRF